jgi:hypothetical protein
MRKLPNTPNKFGVDPLDVPVYGAKAIAECLNLVDAKGKPNEVRAYRVLESGAVDANKTGTGKMSTWTSTPRRLLRIPRS